MRRQAWMGCILLAVVIGGDLRATSSPFGDGYPHVKVENGNFVVYFSSSYLDYDTDSRSNHLRIVYSPVGELLAPRHLRPAPSDDQVVHDLGIKEELHVAGETISFSPLIRGQPIPFYTVKKGKKTEEHRLPWGEQRNLQLEAVAGDANSICMMMWSGEELSLYHFDRGRFDPPQTVTIGKPLLMVSLFVSPDVSNLVKIGDRYCFGWMRFNSGKQRSEVLISTWKPGEAKTVDSVLEEIAHWNTWMSLGAINDHICLAYHCRYQGEYPGFGKLITVFRKIDPASGAALPSK